jgi:hypothetical protein
MVIVDERLVRAPSQLCFQVAADVENWPAILPHYRWVRFRRKSGFATGIVEMAAWRDFGGAVRYPTWWVSDMSCHEQQCVVNYTHVEGVTTGMRVQWSCTETPDATRVRITHDWQGPAWPLIGRFAWEHVIADHFVSAIAQRTLAGVAAEAERQAVHNHASRSLRR